MSSTLLLLLRGNVGAAVTNSHLTSEIGCSNPGPYGKKLAVAYRWSVVYSTEP